MRESIGTAWIMIIVMTFITLFSGYLAFSINYSKSFRVKDGIIERIHKHNGFVDKNGKNTLVEIDNFLAEINYNARGDCYRLCHGQDGEYAGIRGTSVDRGDATNGNTYNYCIVKVTSKAFGDDPSLTADFSAVYYKVIVFFSLQIGSISLFSQFNTTGQTQTMYFANDQLVFG